MKPTYQIFMYAYWGFLVLAFVWMGMQMYDSLDGVYINKPLVFNTDVQNLQTDKKVYHPGDSVSLLWNICKTRNYTSKTTWRLINETVVTFPDQGSKIAGIGCLVNKSITVGEIPRTAVPGTHHLEGVAAVTIDTPKTLYYSFRSQDFQVQ